MWAEFWPEKQLKGHIENRAGSEAEYIVKSLLPNFQEFSYFFFNFRNSDVEKMREEMRLLCKQKLQATYSDYSHDKLSRDKAVFKLMHKSIAQLTENYPNLEYSVINESFTKLCRTLIADSIIDRGIRVDGRKKDDLRNIGCQVKNFLCF